MHPDKEKWLEILAVIITGLLKFVLVDWLHLHFLYIIGACLFWIVFIFKKYKNDRSVLKRWGFQRNNLKKSLLYLLPFALIGIAGIIIYGIVVKATFLNWHIIPIFIFYPAWGIIQQFMIAGLIAGNLKTVNSLKINNLHITLLVSLLFSLVHYPSIPLMIYAFIMEFVFLRVYFKWQNLWSLGLYHGWVSSFFLFFVSERDLLNELLVIFQ
jgi:hypothetical protein